MTKYDHKLIEPKWQKIWEESGIYKTSEDKDKKKCYVLDMFPYPSGDGLHVGHPKGYIATDVYSRFKKMNGFNILHPMGFDAFGLPAENFAIKNKIHPRVAVEKNIKRFKEQLSVIGFNYDWDREVNTTDPEYYKWTQWIFLKLLEKGLAYESYEPINWCPSCQTGLANEDLQDGKCERCGSTVIKKPMRQWVLRITDYAERLLSDIDELNWPESIKESQRNWIGKSEGALISFKLKAESGKGNDTVKVFTTRADTLYGATYLVLAPEHPLLREDNFQFSISNFQEVKKYIESASKKEEIERTDAKKEKTGVELEGIKAINPATGEEIPVWIADYVLGSYGTGAIMAVPSHDGRDFEFAKKFNIPNKIVIEPITGTPQNNEEFRKSIVAIVKNPKTGKFLSINWGADLGGNLFIGGGIEGNEKGNESNLEAAIREIKEETGYKNLKHISSCETIHHHYRAHSKNVNRIIEAAGLYFELENEEIESLNHAEDEKGKFSVEWISEKEVLSRVNDPLHSLVFNRLVKGEVYDGEGTLINSGEFDGMTSEEAREKITEKFGKKTVKYKIRDWVFSRQRYWGEPIPVIHCPHCAEASRGKENAGVVPVPEKDLPVRLPEVEHYEPAGTGESPLANIADWVNTTCPKCDGPAKRETNTMPQWAGSSWYYLRYIDNKNTKALVDKKKEKYWSPVDLYVGGAEHATRHLIYARFWHKFLYDIGVVNYAEPFTRLHNVGLILAEDGKKMSKRYGNVINPDDIVERWGADSLRLYEMFMGPFDQSIAWSTDGLAGPRRFLERVWNLSGKIADIKIQNESLKGLYKTIKKVGEDIENFRFNTAVSSMMILVNEIEKMNEVPNVLFKDFLKILSPFAPHITEELWHKIGNDASIHEEIWPVYDEKLIEEDVITIGVQLDGKIRGQITINKDTTEEEVKEMALALPKIKEYLSGRSVKKVIYVKGKVLSIVSG